MKTQKQLRQITFETPSKQLITSKKQHKGLNYWDFVEFIKIIFIICSDYFWGTLSEEQLFSEHLLFDTCFTVNYFFMNWISESFNISNFISNRSQMFAPVDVFKTRGSISAL